MGIRFLCPNGHKLNVKEFLAGKRGTCPHCNVKFFIPMGSQDTPVAEAPEAAVPSVSPLHAGMLIPTEPSASISKPAFQMASARPVVAAAVPAAAAGAPKTDALAEAPQASWYVRLTTGDQFGPAGADDMKQWLGEDRIPPDSLVWREGWEDWLRADVVFPKAPVPTPAPAMPAMPAAPAFVPNPPAPMPAPAMPAAFPAPMPPAPVGGFPAPGAARAAQPVAGHPAYPVGAQPVGGFPVAARPVGMPQPVAAVPFGPGMQQPLPAHPIARGPAAAFDAAPQIADDNSTDTGEFLTRMSGAEPPKEGEKGDRPPPRKKSNTGVIVAMIVLAVLIVGLSFVVYDLVSKPPRPTPVTLLLIDRYSIKVPGTAQVRSDQQSEPTVGGVVNYRLRDVDLTRSSGVRLGYYLSEIPNPSEARGQADKFFSDTALAAAKRLGGNAEPKSDLMRANASGKEFLITGGGEKMRLQVFIIGKHRLVLTAVSSSQDSLYQEAANEYFASLSQGGN